MTIINPIFDDKSEAGDREFPGLDLQAFICIGMKPQEATVSGGRKYRDEKKEKGRIMGTYTEAKPENLNSILQWARMYSVTISTFGE